MASKLKSFDFTKQSELTVTEKANYPWEQWLDGSIWELIEGEDFTTHPLMMERIIRTRATGRKAQVRMRHVPLNGNPWGKIVLQRVDENAPEAIKRRERAEKRAATQASKKAAPVKAATKHTKANGRPVPSKKAPSKRAARKVAVSA
jgi:hypothetical protein